MQHIFSIVCIALTLFTPAVSYAQDALDVPDRPRDEFYRARVIEIPSEEFDTQFGQGILIEEVLAELLEGPNKGEVITVTNEIPEGLPGSARLEAGDRIVIGSTFIADEITYFLSDRYRLSFLWILIAIFVLTVLVTTGKKTIRSLAGLAISFLVILYYIVPAIAAGQQPTVVAIIGTLAIATLSIFVAHGLHARTAIAFVSTVITIFLSLAISGLAVSGLDLFGWGSEEAFLLQYSNGQVFNLRGILIAGITIGVLGVLDDITTAQAAVVEQLYATDSTLSFRQLYIRANTVGKEHIISLVNTIALAYTGASLPLLLMFEQHSRPAWLVVNSELIMEEIVRILIGSIVLVLAVPITTSLAVLYYTKKRPTVASTDHIGHAH